MSGDDAIAALKDLGFGEGLAAEQRIRFGVNATPFMRRFVSRSYKLTGQIIVDVLLPDASHCYGPDDSRLIELWNDAQVALAKEEIAKYEAAKSLLNICS